MGALSDNMRIVEKPSIEELEEFADQAQSWKDGHARSIVQFILDNMGSDLIMIALDNDDFASAICAYEYLSVRQMFLSHGFDSENGGFYINWLAGNGTGGAGAILRELTRAADQNEKIILLESEDNAITFYEKYGFNTLDDGYSQMIRYPE